MKKAFLFVSACLLFVNGYSQCTPGAATGTPGLSPAPGSVPCIERGVYYDYTLQFENFSGFSCSGFNVSITSASIDNITNFPCGLTWQADQTSYASGETGCIRITGTSTDVVGQYPLEVHMTFVLDILGSPYTVSGTIDQLQQQLSQFSCSAPAVNTDYYSRVINPGNSCPAIGSSSDLTSSGTTCPTPPQIAVSISGNTTICSGSSTTLTANVTNSTGTVTYSWSPGGSNASAINVSPTSTTPYSVTVTDQNGSATTSASVTVNQVPNAAFTATVNGASASTNNITTGATSYSWDFGDGTAANTQQNPSHTYTANGTYTITLSATNSCGSDVATQQVTITSLSSLSVSISGNTTICSGASTTLTANATNSTGAVTYSWSSGGNSQSITVSPTTTTPYSVTATDQNGSTNASATVTVIASPDAVFTVSTSGNSVTVANASTGANSYSWNFGDTQTSTLQDPPAHTYTANGTYDIRLIATSANCGSDTAVQKVTITGVFVTSIEYNLDFDVFPNPGNGRIFLQLSSANQQPEIYDVKIFDLSGKKVFDERFNVNSGTLQKELALENLAKGIYALHLNSKESFGVKKIVLQ